MMTVRPDKSRGNIGRPLRWLDDDGRLLKGRHRGELLSSVVEHSHGRSYIRWAIDNVVDMNEDDRKVMQSRLDRQGEDTW